MPLESLQNGRYRTVRELGSGSMGEVFLVDDTVIGRQVAIKTMRADPATYPDTESIKDAVRLFKREAQAIARLEHPNILPLYDFGEEKGEKTVFTYMVMPHCQAGSLENWLKHNHPNQPLPLDEVAYFIEQAAEALQYSHEHGIIHQDVKPSNFLLRTHTSGQLLPDLLLADFGIARMGIGTTITTITTVSAGPRGTPRYMPPEQWEGKPLPASDQYALAVMAYQLLTRKYPFTGDQMLQLMYQHLQQTPEPPGKWNPQISSGLDAVILRALAKKPAERFPSIQDFARALRQALPRVKPAQAGQTQDTSAFATAPMETAHNPSIITLSAQTQPARPPLFLPANTSSAPPFGQTTPVYPSARPAQIPWQQPVGQTVQASVRSQMPPTSPMQPPRPPQASSRGRAIFFISLALLVVLVGAGIAYYTYSIRQQSSANTNQNPYTTTMSTLRFADPLSQPAMWQALPYDQLTDGFCLFQQGTYHASSNKTHVYTLCPAATQQPITGDMTFEVQMQILHGDCGGFLFRGDFQQGNFYYFDVCFDGHHYLTTYQHFALLQPLPTQASVSPALLANAQTTITLGVVTRGNVLTFYLNNQQIDQITDSTYTRGQIALLCFAINKPTEVVFSHARLWTA